VRTLADLLEGYRRGDAAAQTELLTRLEAQLRALVRALVGKQIRTERESMDVCQSLLLAFHMQAQAGKVAFENEEAFKGYLRTMIRNKLANLADRLKTAKRGGGAAAMDAGELQLPAFDPSASMVAGTAELRKRMEGALGEEERAILEGLLAGRGYAEIAGELGKSPDAVRMAWNRARERLVAGGILRPPG
jgi:RNA polymerase sigma factor (sigma-70 family)